jgi:hypothetical protein
VYNVAESERIAGVVTGKEIKVINDEARAKE